MAENPFNYNPDSNDDQQNPFSQQNSNPDNAPYQPDSYNQQGQQNPYPQSNDPYSSNPQQQPYGQQNNYSSPQQPYGQQQSQQPAFGQQNNAFNSPQPPYGQQPVSPFQQPTGQRTQESKVFGVLSLILGIVSFCTCCFMFVPIIAGIIGIVLGIIGMKKAPSSKGLCITGIILSAAGILIGAIIIIFILANRDLYDQIYTDILNQYYEISG